MNIGLRFRYVCNIKFINIIISKCVSMLWTRYTIAETPNNDKRAKKKKKLYNDVKSH